MPITCNSTDCLVKLPYEHFASVSYTDFTRSISADCSKNAIWFTDDPGALSIPDEEFEPLLSTESPSTTLVTLFSSDAVAEHWEPCSRTYQELAWFFNAPVKAGGRPASITVAYRDPAETWIDAYVRATECQKCFRHVSHVSHSITDTPYHDLADQIDFAKYILAERKMPYFPTADETLATDYTEVASVPGQSGSTEVGAAWAYMINSEDCQYECTDSDNIPVVKDWYQPDHMMLMAYYASFGFSDSQYNMAGFMGAGNFPGAKTASFTQDEVINITGVVPETGISADAARSVNVFVASQANTRGYIEALTDNFYRISSVLKRFAIEEDILATSLKWQHNLTYEVSLVDETQLAALDGLLTGRVTDYLNKKMVPELPSYIADNLDDYPDYKWSDKYNNIIAGGDGNAWVLARQPITELSDAELSQGYSGLYEFCFIDTFGLKRVRVSVCATTKPSIIG